MYLQSDAIFVFEYSGEMKFSLFASKLRSFIDKGISELPLFGQKTHEKPNLYSEVNLVGNFQLFNFFEWKF